MIREHGLLLFMPSELNIAFIKFQAEKELGRSYAGLYLLNDALFRHGCISQETYKIYEQKYGEKLVKAKEVESKPLMKVKMEEDQKLKDLDKQFKNAVDQWELHPSIEWRRKWVKLAEKWKDKIPNAKLVLEFANKEVIPHG
jgi:hypothetical protein